MQGLAGRHFRATSVHFERSRCRDNHNGVGIQPANAALDVAELLHAHVGTEAAFSEHVANALWAVALLGPGQFQGDLVCNDRGVAVRDVCEWPSMDEDRCALVPCK